MQTFKKGNINLDKTIALSKQIVKEEIEPSSIFEVEKICGEMVSFNFKRFNNTPSLPIEHIGLAQLVYEKAVDQFSTTVVKEDGTQERIFEVMPKGYHIADVLNNCDIDTLAWYKSRSESGEPLKFPTKYNGNIVSTDLNKFERTVTFDQNTEHPCTAVSDRFRAVSYALCEALCDYEDSLAEAGYGEQTEYITYATVEEARAINSGLLQLKEKTFEHFTANKYEDVAGANTMTENNAPGEPVQE